MEVLLLKISETRHYDDKKRQVQDNENVCCGIEENIRDLSYLIFSA